jgi:hypothetical protein
MQIKDWTFNPTEKKLAEKIPFEPGKSSGRNVGLPIYQAVQIKELV